MPLQTPKSVAGCSRIFSGVKLSCTFPRGKLTSLGMALSSFAVLKPTRQELRTAAGDVTSVMERLRYDLPRDGRAWHENVEVWLEAADASS